MIKLTDIRIRREERFILDIEQLELKQGETLAVIGPNGAGKSTLLHLLAHLVRAEGSFSYKGQGVPWGDLAYRRRVAMVLQDPLLLSDTVLGNVECGLWIRGLPKPSRTEKAMFWLRQMGIDHLAKRPAKTLSGGEAQRAGLARALALESDLLLLDEPFSALDPIAKASILRDLKPILLQRGLTTVFVTHDRTEALMLGDRLAVLDQGKLLQLAPPEEVITAPKTPAVAALVGADTIVSGQITESRDGLAFIQVGSQTLVAVDKATNGHVWACLRPEDVILHREPLHPSSLRNHLTGTVKAIVPLGAQFRITLDCGFDLVALITKPAFLELGLYEGENLHASFKASNIHLISIF